MDSSAEPQHFRPAEGRRFIARALAAVGVPAADAEAVAEKIILADLRGIDSHGIIRLPNYLRRLRAGGINAKPQLRVIMEGEGTALLDGDNGLGHLVMRRAAELAIAKAERTGIAWVGARNSNHAGAAAAYAMMPLAHDMIGLYLAVANNNHMPPTGGLEALLGTNPIAIGIPALEEPPMVLDIATTAISMGRINVAAARGESLAEGLVMDHDGRPITDARQAGHGLLLPMGGYKGFGLSLVFALLAGALNGIPVGRDVINNTGPESQPAMTGQAVMALKVANFAEVTQFKRSVDKVLCDIRTSRTAPGVEEVRFPGLQGHRTAAQREREGIPIGAGLVGNLAKAAADLGIRPLELA